jgi:hypothetical protein
MSYAQSKQPIAAAACRFNGIERFRAKNRSWIFRNDEHVWPKALNITTANDYNFSPQRHVSSHMNLGSQPSIQFPEE